MSSLKPKVKAAPCRKRTPIRVPARVALREAFVPRWDGEIEGMVVNHLKKNYWRVACSMEYDDALQEARLLFLELAQKYGPTVTEPRHFMALFKTSWGRKFIDLSADDVEHRKVYPYRHGKRADTLDPEVDWQEIASADQFVGETDNAGFLRVMVQQAPREVKTVLALFLSAPAELMELAVASWREDRRVKRNPSEKICRMLGLPPDLDVMQMTADYFTHSR